jgi:hypothetical protein
MADTPTRKYGRFYTVAELASMAQLATNTVRWHCRAGRLRGSAVQTSGHQWAVPIGAGNRFVIWAKGRREES